MGEAWGRAALVAALLMTAACAAPGSQSRAEGNKAAAQAAYDSCLSSAARYADTGKESAADLAQIVAPMCYPQYLALEKDIAEDLGSRARRQFELDADAKQAGFATAAIKQERAKQQLAGVIAQ
ncbi:MAG TPA: hypothetical protein VKZ79_07875 [Alphaproteobacteria bacterium]|nr:hypothetical protein [Alphaproteobacteria bacterium]